MAQTQSTLIHEENLPKEEKERRKNRRVPLVAWKKNPRKWINRRLSHTTDSATTSHSKKKCSTSHS